MLECLSACVRVCVCCVGVGVVLSEHGCVVCLYVHG